MAELGSGGGTSYPGALDTDIIKEVDNSTLARADVPNDLAAAIIAIQTELGTDPAGSKTDVKTYLQTEHDADGTHGAITPTGITLAGSAWPSFAAYLSGNQAIGAATPVKVAFDTEEFDTNGNYDAATNYRFTPTVAGKYLVTVSLRLASTDTGIFSAELYKNGSPYRITTNNDDLVARQLWGAWFVDMNGTTDYLEVYVDSDGDTAYTVDAVYKPSVPVSVFEACRIG